MKRRHFGRGVEAGLRAGGRTDDGVDGGTDRRTGCTSAILLAFIRRMCLRHPRENELIHSPLFILFPFLRTSILLHPVLEVNLTKYYLIHQKSQQNKRGIVKTLPAKAMFFVGNKIFKPTEYYFLSLSHNPANPFSSLNFSFHSSGLP